ncbi:MAG: hypothetical protein ACOX9C_06230 [Kiritimatiellia bacterium]|jgi:hypothetical protein
MKLSCTVGKVMMSVASYSALANPLVPVAPFGVFTEKERLGFDCGAGAERPYRIMDWRGNEVAAGTCGSNGCLTVEDCGAGYYSLEVADGGRADVVSFVVVRPPTRLGTERFFGADSAQSWTERTRLRCPWHDGDMHRALSETAGKMGLSHMRDRLSREAVEPERGVRTFGIETFRSAGLLASNGVETCTAICGTPRWADPIQSLPRDLAAYYDFCRATSEAFKGRTANWEVFNEQDACGAPEPVWDYAAAQKAAYLGLKAGNPACTVLPGAVCLNRRGVYDEGMYANDLAYYGDVFNLHIYLAPAAFPDALSDLRAFMAKAGIGDREVWITENGMDLEGSATEPSAVRGVLQHSWAQELLQAEYYPKSQMAMMMGGVSRSCFFFFGSFHERSGAKDWGTFRRDGTVKPVCAAMATAAQELGDATLLGEVDLGAKLRGYLFEHHDGTKTLAFWSASPVDTGKGWPLDGNDHVQTFDLDVADGGCRLSDLCGTTKSVVVEAGRPLSLTATRYPSYLHGRFDMPIAKAAQKKGTRGATVAADDTDLSIVFRVDLDPDDFRITRGKTMAELKVSEGRLTVQAWNLSDTAKTGMIAAAGCRLRGIPERVVLPPFGKMEFPATLSVPEGIGETKLLLSGAFNGCGTTALVMPVVCLDESFLARCNVKELAASRKPSMWKRNDSAARCSCEWDENEQAIRFHYEWDDPRADRWFYPLCQLDLPEESLDDALMLEFEVKSAQDKVENDYHVSNLMLGTFIGYAPPMLGWEIRRIPVSGIKPDATEFGLGANPRGMKVDYWIRNLRLIKKGAKDGK